MHATIRTATKGLLAVGLAAAFMLTACSTGSDAPEPTPSLTSTAPATAPAATPAAVPTGDGGAAAAAAIEALQRALGGTVEPGAATEPAEQP
jgi:hypothetical protein